VNKASYPPSHPWVQSQEVVVWAKPADWPRLTMTEIHVWWANLDVAPARRQRLFAYLSASERRRALRLRFAHLRDRYIAGRGLLRELIGRYLDADPAQHHFKLGSFGKPSLPTPGAPELCFNFSDSTDRGLFAFAWERELGVDLECLDREVNHERISARKFTAREHRALMAMPVQVRRDAFLACWTRKEGFGKAKGVGIRYPLDSVSLCERCADPMFDIVEPAPSGGAWRLVQIYPAPSYVGSLVYQEGDVTLRYFAVPDAE